METLLLLSFVISGPKVPIWLGTPAEYTEKMDQSAERECQTQNMKSVRISEYRSIYGNGHNGGMYNYHLEADYECREGL